MREVKKCYCGTTTNLIKKYKRRNKNGEIIQYYICRPCKANSRMNYTTPSPSPSPEYLQYAQETNNRLMEKYAK